MSTINPEEIHNCIEDLSDHTDTLKNILEGLKEVSVAPKLVRVFLEYFEDHEALIGALKAAATAPYQPHGAIVQ